MGDPMFKKLCLVAVLSVFGSTVVASQGFDALSAQEKSNFGVGYGVNWVANTYTFCDTAASAWKNKLDRKYFVRCLLSTGAMVASGFLLKDSFIKLIMSNEKVPLGSRLHTREVLKDPIIVALSVGASQAFTIANGAFWSMVGQLFRRGTTEQEQEEIAQARKKTVRLWGGMSAATALLLYTLAAYGTMQHPAPGN